MEENVFFSFMGGRKKSQRMLCFPSGVRGTEQDSRGSALTLRPSTKRRIKSSWNSEVIQQASWTPAKPPLLSS